MEKVKVVNLDEETDKELRSLFPIYAQGLVRMGERGCVLRREYCLHADAVRAMAVRADDVWLLGFPRSGTTLTEELLWLLHHDLDYAAAAAAPLKQRLFYTDLEFGPNRRDAEAAPSPRHFKVHAPLSLQPAALLATARVVHIARDPRDVLVSFYHLLKSLKLGYNGTMKKFLELFLNDQVLYTPYFDNILESWNVRSHPNMMFIFYEELIKDLPGHIKRLAHFYGKNYSEVEVQRLCEYLSFDTFKNNAAIHPDLRPGSELVVPGGEPFVRRGKANTWREYFDEEMTEQAERWLQKHLSATDLRFPS